MIVALSVFLVCWIALMVGVGTCAKNNEAKSWNNGVCEECNTPWKNFDTDSQGGRGYKCGCGEFHTTWISYAVDKK